MIEVENAGRWRSGATYDKVAALLIGVVAVLAATFAIQQAHFGLAAQRAQIMGARVSVDLATTMSTSSTAESAILGAQQQALLVGMAGVSRQIAGSTAADESAVAIGGAEQLAAEDLKAVIAASGQASGKAPLDPYTAGLVTSSTGGLTLELQEQNRQVDVANDLGSREQMAVLGLSLITLAGVLAGVAAVLGHSRAGWGTLAVGWGVAAVATAFSLTTLF
jgi:hypothetical protein